MWNVNLDGVISVGCIVCIVGALVLLFLLLRMERKSSGSLLDLLKSGPLARLCCVVYAMSITIVAICLIVSYAAQWEYYVSWGEETYLGVVQSKDSDTTTIAKPNGDAITLPTKYVRTEPKYEGLDYPFWRVKELRASGHKKANVLGIELVVTVTGEEAQFAYLTPWPLD